MSRLRPCALAAAAAAWLTLSACSDGYTGKGDVLRLEYGMSQEDTLYAMNQIGHGKHLETHARFVLLDGCVLEVHARRQFDGKDSRAILLPGTEAALEKHPGGETYSVKLNSATPGYPDHTVLSNAPWSEATQMKWLLDYVRRFC
ncbi:hypothetical protein F3K02_13820 [Hydrogenophaga sp. D2P1]|uniref:Lipoprotein n=1 Tax=Hydrogenophaga aromaticivorans TaxID=2610898 RepID=A0A7Y8KX83_9BURK|nr:hypothetical protein [Hydrogenophaga aromaticivorans]NWF46320.1 hypothetical protein [Hydrogenophaga aromaticivorans]